MPLQLSPTQRADLQQLADFLKDQHIKLYEHHLFDQRGVVDTKRWKLSAEKDDVRVYSERVTKADFEAKGEISPVLIAEGTVPGELEDVMLATCNPTTHAMGIKSAHTKEGLTDFCVLATVVAPSASEPFRSLDVKWVEHYHPFQFLSVVKQRDFVCMEATGIEYLANGERVGYHVTHSVHFPQTPVLETNTRGNMSSCVLYRQKSNNVVDIYLKVVLTPLTELMRKLVVKIASTSMLCILKMPLAGRKKKLSWYFHRRYTKSHSSSSSDSASELCRICHRNTAGALRDSFRSSHCEICFASVCSACKVKKKLAIPGQSGPLIKTKLTFCPACLDEAYTTSAAKIAMQQIHPPQHVI